LKKKAGISLGSFSIFVGVKDFLFPANSALGNRFISPASFVCDNFVISTAELTLELDFNLFGINSRTCPKTHFYFPFTLVIGNVDNLLSSNLGDHNENLARLYLSATSLTLKNRQRLLLCLIRTIGKHDFTHSTTETYILVHLNFLSLHL
jgi:hypothetical protein